MLEGLKNISKIPELQKRILFTFLLLAVYRIGAHVPTPGIDTAALAAFFEQAKGSLLGLFDMFAGGALSNLSVFALGIMPYISASIILQLLTVAVPLPRKAFQGRGRGPEKDHPVHPIRNRGPEPHSGFRYCHRTGKHGGTYGDLHRHHDRLGI